MFTTSKSNSHKIKFKSRTSSLRNVQIALVLQSVCILLGTSAFAQDPVVLKPAVQTVTTQTVTTQTLLMPNAPEVIKAERVRHDVGTAMRLAKYRWFDKMALADPAIVASVCSYSSSATLLAKHPHIGAIADADHYFCRRLTKYRGAARALVANPEAYKVIARDPEGLYRAIKNDRGIAKKLYKNQRYDQMIVENPELGKILARYM